MSILARYDKTWILSSQVRHLQPVSAICDGAGNDSVIYSVVYAAMALMLYFGLASVQLTRNATGPKNLVLNKRALVDGDIVPPRALAAIRVAPQESLPLWSRSTDSASDSTMSVCATLLLYVSRTGFDC